MEIVYLLLDMKTYDMAWYYATWDKAVSALCFRCLDQISFSDINMY
jgi:hypothetical protein